MKRLILLLWSISLLFAGCDMNDSLSNEIDNDLKSAEMKMVPIKGEIQSHVTESLNGVPVIGNLSGNISHLGKLIMDKSTWYTISVEMDEQTWTISWEMFGSVCAANGDFLKYTLSGAFSIPNNQITGQAVFDGGTGRFCQAQGSMEFTGYADDPMNIATMYMQVEGLITNVGSSHSGENATVTQNESIAGSFIEAWDLHDTDLLTSLFADEFTYTEVTTGHIYASKDALVMYATATIAGIPDTRFEVVSIVANERFAVVEWIWKGTNTVGWPSMGIPPTGKYFELPGISVMEIENGQIIWNKDYWDWNTFLQLIGVIP
ncbi:nuclear transport factor 2 family protein [Maribellus sp. CM-23]|uniref:ester cyclase n=1 Tax=Maribellus sp. CM-23 TaxID=2781026 RepID=UPI001F2751AD|nr:nuclear transport factor 2 family protein [Maribellus sp. CM-23]MCE4563100.1 nuclear transport factor 2 family protein [Maribellus sp. CM-23]